MHLHRIFALMIHLLPSPAPRSFQTFSYRYIGVVKGLQVVLSPSPFPESLKRNSMRHLIISLFPRKKSISHRVCPPLVLLQRLSTDNKYRLLIRNDNDETFFRSSYTLHRVNVFQISRQLRLVQFSHLLSAGVKKVLKTALAQEGTFIKTVQRAYLKISIQ